MGNKAVDRFDSGLFEIGFLGFGEPGANIGSAVGGDDGSLGGIGDVRTADGNFAGVVAHLCAGFGDESTDFGGAVATLGHGGRSPFIETVLNLQYH